MRKTATKAETSSTITLHSSSLLPGDLPVHIPENIRTPKLAFVLPQVSLE